ncbi:2-C-methyl-D-erythritol 4-phosphate cytidylyltransferase [Actinomyces sp. B33]|uniref:IspD/TarI family cytidylyltransferase n=1 Tax=Actinomyces sp. B33 TaxID=2942131 RepID=UPI002342623D|nr:2-C-methyl-D-erythritol 4-phosphate cytidylyltransferase [Actinomyces sp. B33]MDC4232373.1 2-C-methyl-D-erythritol 4-phosphate cytidylyltransferase [Actinomyces sp. B33]
MSPSPLAVLTAAGSGTRLGCDGPKALVNVAGAPMVLRAARALAAAGVRGIVVTAPADRLDAFRALFPDERLPGGDAARVRVVAGSPRSRQASVALGCRALDALARELGEELTDDTTVLVHDAARCLTPVDAIRRVVDAVVPARPAVVPAIPVVDTLARIDPDLAADGPRPILGPADRRELIAVQTPQGFSWRVLRRAHEAGAGRSVSDATAATDDAGLVAALGIRVEAVAGDPLALKVTTPLDLDLATLLADRAR